VRLPEARSTQAFQKYMDWTYTSDVDLDPTLDLCRKDRLLIDLYLLGDVLDDVKLRKKTLQLLNTALCSDEGFLSTANCNRIWEHTPPDSSLRKWIVDAYVTLCDHEIMATCGTSFSAEFVLQVAIKALEEIKSGGANEAGLNERVKTYMEPEDDA